jgi:hypothetical protein
MAERARANRAKRSSPKISGTPVALLSDASKNEIYKRWSDRLIPLRAQRRIAHERLRIIDGQFSLVLKAAEKEGCIRAGMLAYLRDTERDAVAVAKIEEGRARMHQVNDTRLHQMDLFAGALKPPEPVSPYLQGKKDGCAGKACQPNFQLGTPQAEQYVAGWDDGQAENHASLRQASIANAMDGVHS